MVVHRSGMNRPAMPDTDGNGHDGFRHCHRGAMSEPGVPGAALSTQVQQLTTAHEIPER